VKGEVLWTLGETRVAEQNAAKVYQIEIITLAIAGGTLIIKSVPYSVAQSKASAWMLMIAAYWKIELTSCIARRLRQLKRVGEGMSDCNRISMRTFVQGAY